MRSCFSVMREEKLREAEEKLSSLILSAKSNFICDLVLALPSQPSRVYQFIRSLRKESSVPSVLYLGDQSADTSDEKAHLFNQYFHSVFTASDYILPSLETIATNPETLSDVVISEDEVYHALITLDSSKAMGLDGIGPRVLRACALALCPVLHHLFSLCLTQQKFPMDWKLHKIVPVFKSADKSSIANYRPISLLSVTSKVFERLIVDKIGDFIFRTITPSQFGFLPCHSSVQQVLLFINALLQNWNSGSVSEVIYLDICKAFDSVPHQELLFKLWRAGIVGNLWCLLRDYLTSRLQCVAVEDSISGFLPVSSGVPQGSIVGPLLFILYVNDLPVAVPSSKVFMYADDTKLLRHIHCEADYHGLQSALDLLSSWSDKWLLRFNGQKCVSLAFAKKNCVSTFDCSLNGKVLDRKDSVKDLGIVMSSDLTWSKHLDFIIAKSYKQLGLLRRTFGVSIGVDTKKSLYLSLVRSQLSYASQIWRPQLIRDIVRLEKVQRRASRFILPHSSLCYKERLTTLKVLPLMMWLEIADVMFFIKQLRDPVGNFDISEFLSFTSFIYLPETAALLFSI